MTTRAGRGPSTPPPGRRRGPQGRGQSGPGAARASGRTPPGSGKGSGKGSPGRSYGNSAGGKSIGGKGTGGKGAVGKGGGGKGAGAKGPGAATPGRDGGAPRRAASRMAQPGLGPGPSAEARRPPRTGGRPPSGRGPGGAGRPRRPPRRRPRSRRLMRLHDPMKRLNVGLLAIAFVLSLFAGRLVQLQGIQSQKYAERAAKQRLNTIELPAVRGDITDATGRPLAMTVEARGIFADPSIVEVPKRGQIVAQLSPLLGVDPARLMRALSAPKSKFEYIARGVTPARAKLVMAMGFKGIGTLPEYRREYPSNDLASNVVGFVNGEGKGGAGLEFSMNRLLAGRGGFQRVEIGADGQHIPMGEDQIKRPNPGQGVRLTLLSDLQYEAQQALNAQVKASGAGSGSVIVMDSRSGHILAMATSPGYDPNNYGRTPLANTRNPAIADAFEPGSTNKVITAAAVIEKAGVTPETPFAVPDQIRRYDRVFHDSHPHKPERLTFAGVLAKSSNVGTILASEKIQQQTLYQFLRDFGFGQATGLKLPGETRGVLSSPDKWSGTDRYPIAFGQTISVNAVQMASVYATIANGGVRVAPTLVAGAVDGRGTYVPAPAPAQRRVISTGTSRELVRMLEGVTTDEGTAPKAQIPGYRVAGKTGTAERVNPRCGCYTGGGYTASFAGFAPADAPQLVVQVVIQDPKRGSHYGGDVAAPVFKRVMTFALQARKIPPTGTRSPKINIYADR